MSIDWSEPMEMISKHFSVHEALWLPSWNRMAAAGDGLNADVENALLAIFAKMDLVRDYLGLPIIVHCAYRPAIYNAQVGGAAGSCHMARSDGGVLLGAVDWHAVVPGCDIGTSCDILKAKLLPELAGWGLRMEHNGDQATWVHLDNKPVEVGGNRYFLP